MKEMIEKGGLAFAKGVGLQIVAAIVILVVGFRIAKMVQRMLSKTLERMEIEVSLRKFLQSAAYVVICAVAIFMACEKVGISSASIIALLGSAGLAISLSMQNVLTNFAGGVILLVIKPFKVGDYIVCDSGEGTVESIGLVYTTLSTMDNRRVVLPNGGLSNGSLTNVTGQTDRKLELKIGIGYSSDLKKAKDIMQELFASHPKILADRGLQVFVSDLAESSVVIGARGWVLTGDYWQVKWDLTEQIKLRFDQEGIEIPFRQLDVHVQ